MRLPTLEVLFCGILSAAILAGCGNAPRGGKAEKTKTKTDQEKTKTEKTKTTPSTGDDKKPIHLAANNGKKRNGAAGGVKPLVLPTGDESTSVIKVEANIPEKNAAGIDLEYTIKVSNISGNTALTNINVFQRVSKSIAIRKAEVSFDRADKTSSGGDTPNDMSFDAGTQFGRQVSWSLDNLEPGDVATIKVTARGMDEGLVVNYLGVRYDPLLKLATQFTKPKLVVMRAPEEDVENKSSFDVKYTVENTGTGAANEVVITDKLPEWLTVAAINGKESKKDSNKEKKDKSGDSDVEILKLNSLAPGAKETVAVTLQADMGDKLTKTYASKAKVTHQFGDVPAAAIWSDEKSTTIRWAKIEILAARKTESAETKAGTAVEYEAIVKNTGYATAGNVNLKLKSRGAEVVDSSVSPKSESGEFVFDLGTIAGEKEPTAPVKENGEAVKEKTQTPETSKTVKIVVKHTQGGTVNNVFTATSADPKLSAEKPVETTVVGLEPKLFTRPEVAVGDTFGCTIQVINKGAETSKEAKLTMKLPKRLGFVGDDKGETKEREFDVPALAQSADKDFTVQLQVLKEAEGKKPEGEKPEAGDAKIEVSLHDGAVKTLKSIKITAPKKPEAKKPEAKKPEAKKPEAKKPEAKKPEAKKPEAKKPEAKKPEAKKPEAKKPEAKKPEAKKPEAKKPEAKKPEAKKPEAKNPEPK